MTNACIYAVPWNTVCMLVTLIIFTRDNCCNRIYCMY